jgi:hypothetical protein
MCNKNKTSGGAATAKGRKGKTSKKKIPSPSSMITVKEDDVPQRKSIKSKYLMTNEPPYSG